MKIGLLHSYHSRNTLKQLFKMGSQDNRSQNYEFVIIKITDATYEELSDFVTIVPVSFLSKDEEKQFYVRYLAPPHTEEDQQLIFNLSSTKGGKAPESWPQLKCTLLSLWFTYKDASKHFETPSITAMNADVEEDMEALYNVPSLQDELNADENSVRKSLLVLEKEKSFEDSNGEFMETHHDKGTIERKSNNNNTHEPVTNDMATFKEDFKKYFYEQLQEVKRSLKTYVKAKIDNLDSKITNIQQKVTQIKTFVQESRPFRDSENVLSLDKISGIYEQTFPILEYNEFKIFDNKIIGDPYNSLKIYFGCNINTKEEKLLVKVITPIFKTFFARDLIIMFTAQKTKNKNKTNILKGTNFFKCVMDAMSHAYNMGATPVITEKDVLTLLGAMINNASDWDGYRAKRRKESVSESDSEDDESKRAKRNE